ncbi:MAG: hypothetical protein ACQESR_21110, partial [Planctomycetota bacterium]
IFQAVRFSRLESCPTQAVLPLVGLAAETVIHDRYMSFGPKCTEQPRSASSKGASQNLILRSAPHWIRASFPPSPFTV